jgi:hypothetical protein
MIGGPFRSVVFCVRISRAIEFNWDLGRLPIAVGESLAFDRMSKTVAPPDRVAGIARDIGDSSPPSPSSFNSNSASLILMLSILQDRARFDARPSPKRKT